MADNDAAGPGSSLVYHGDMVDKDDDSWLVDGRCP